MRGIFSLLRSSKGQSLIEFALILPFLLVLIGGVVDFGLSLFVGHVIQNAAREGARAGAVLHPEGGSLPAIDGSCTVGNGSDCADNAVLAAAYQALPQNVGLLNDFTIESKFSAIPPPQRIEVTITGTYNWFILQLIFADPVTLSRSATMRWEWQHDTTPSP